MNSTRIPMPGAVPACLFLLLVAAFPVSAQNVSLNYESLSTMEEPLARHIGDVTVVATSLLDARLLHDMKYDDDNGTDFLGNLEIYAHTQLANRWRVGIRYFGQYDTNDLSMPETQNTYRDNVALEAGGVWGTLLVGNVSGVVREQTRRLRGAGNAAVDFDNVLGRLEEQGAAYVGRYGPWVASAAADEDGNYDLGAMYQRPLGRRDYRLTFRTTEGAFVGEDDTSLFETRSAGLVGEIIYGSIAIDAGFGFERLTSELPDMDRWYLTTGFRRKLGVLSLSLEGHYGQIEGQDEVAASLGVQYDLARGMSVNFGINHADVLASLEEHPVLDIQRTNAALSLRYAF